MKIFVDTAKLSEIKAAINLGVCDGVTTNPSLIKAAIGELELGMEDYIKEICKTSGKGKPVSLEVISTSEEEMIKEARVVGKNHLRMVFMDKNDRWDAIAFGLGDMSKSSMDIVDAVFNLRENQWDRGSVCELNVRGIKST